MNYLCNKHVDPVSFYAKRDSIGHLNICKNYAYHKNISGISLEISAFIRVLKYIMEIVNNETTTENRDKPLNRDKCYPCANPI